MKTSEIFKESLKFLWNGKGKQRARRSIYICYSLEWVSNSYNISVEKQLDIIENLLKNYSTLDHWLHIECGIRVDAHDMDDIIKLQATRKAWVKHLIKHYESIGD